MPRSENGRRHDVDAEILNFIEQIAERFYTTEQIASYLQLSNATARRYCNNFEFAHVFKLGRDWLVPVEDVEAYKRDRLGVMGRPRKDEVINHDVRPRRQRKAK